MRGWKGVGGRAGDGRECGGWVWVGRCGEIVMGGRGSKVGGGDSVFYIFF